MHTTTLLEPPKSVTEKFVLLIYVLVSVFLFLGKLCERNNLIWKTFPHFCLLMTFVPITHISFLISSTFKNLIFLSLTPDEILWRLVPIIVTCYPILFLPPVPLTLTMVQSIFLNCKIPPAKHLFGLKTTKNKVLIAATAIMSAIFYLRNKREKRCFVVAIHFDEHHSVEFDMLKYLPVLVTTLYFLRRLYFFKSAKRAIKVLQTEYLHMVHIVLFLAVFGTIHLCQILLSISTYRYNTQNYTTRLLGVQDSCILNYLFIYAIPLAKSKRVIEWFNSMNISPNKF